MNKYYFAGALSGLVTMGWVWCAHSHFPEGGVVMAIIASMVAFVTNAVIHEI